MLAATLELMSRSMRRSLFSSVEHHNHTIPPTQPYVVKMIGSVLSHEVGRRCPSEAESREGLVVGYLSWASLLLCTTSDEHEPATRLASWL